LIDCWADHSGSTLMRCYVCFIACNILPLLIIVFHNHVSLFWSYNNVQVEQKLQSKMGIPQADYRSRQPLFITLSQVWSRFQDEVVLLSMLSNLLNSMAPFTNVCVYVRCLLYIVWVCRCVGGLVFVVGAY